jgi:hypothetical protein
VNDTKNKPIATPFTDGVVVIYSPENEAAAGDMPSPKLTRRGALRFSERTVGIRRFYAALQDGAEVSRVIRCPRIRDITTLDAAVVGDVTYRIAQVQYPDDITPPVMDLSLVLVTR